MKHMSLLPYQTIHHQHDHPHLMIIQPQLTDYRTVLTKVGLLRIHITLDRTTSGFRTQLQLGVTIGNRSSTNLPMNKPLQQLSWKQFGSKKRNRELLTIHTTVIIILYYRTVTDLFCTFDYFVAKASQDFSAYSLFDHQIFQLSFNFLHPTPKDVQNNNYRVQETKLIHNLIYYTFLRDKNINTTKSYIHINDQLTSPYFFNYGYKLK